LEEIDRLRAAGSPLVDQVAAALYDLVPARGPSAVEVQPLREDILEFVFGRLPTLGFRVLWFYGDSDRDVICSVAFLRPPGGTVHDAAMDLAIAHREAYFHEPNQVEVLEDVL
jgi:hypothetical protein